MPKPTVTFPRGVEVVVGVVIQNDDGTLLLTQSPKWSDQWVIPGGHINPGETIVEATVREAEEETGLKIQPIAIIYSGESINPSGFHRPSHMVRFNYLASVVGGKVKLDQKELTDHRWVTLSEAFKLDLAPPTRQTLEVYQARRAKK